MIIIGISGKSGCGKSTLSKDILNFYGDEAVHLDIDKVGHRVLTNEEVKKELTVAFGNSVIEDGNVDRKKLGEIVFSARNEMKTLSDITWKYMQIEIEEFLHQNENKVIILDWLLLPTTKYFKMCDLKILLDIPYEIRKQRAIERDGISEDAFYLREKASIDFDYEAFDYVFKENEEISIERLLKYI